MELNAFNTVSGEISWAAATWTAPMVPTLALFTGIVFHGPTTAAFGWSLLGLLMLAAPGRRTRGIGAGLAGSGILTGLVAATMLPVL